ncbi:hypothetical protein QCA50_008698 [Cerrena zonata]|uniref:Uncharacterized protein n=1 Tax=Cerrena zonata TaxID=2478898 RepID=A0AAW0G4R4_9APHY
MVKKGSSSRWYGSELLDSLLAVPLVQDIPISTMSSIEKAENGTVGTVHANNVHQALPQYPPLRKIANPAPLGLFSFASTTFILSLYNVGARGINVPNLVVGMALGVGGLAQFCAGMWEFATGNTFGALAFSSYGGFWFSYAIIFIPGSGISAAYEDTTQLGSAVAIYLLTWFTVTMLLFIATLRRNVALSLLFGFLSVTFLLLGVADYVGNVNITRAGGAFGIITALIAYYIGMAGLLTPEDSWFTLPCW